MKYILTSIRYGLSQIAGRRIYLTLMLIVPLLGALFFINLMDSGLPLKVPTAIVDHDRSALSRQITRNLRAGELIDLVSQPESYAKALEEVRAGKTFGFFLIPDDFQQNALSGRPASVVYYTNLTYFVPGTLALKGFKTQAVTTTAGLAVTTLTAAGLPSSMAGELINPVNIDIRAPGNPWLNYNYYLSNSFVPALLALLITLVTSWSILVDIKDGQSVEWLRRSGGSMIVALMGKLIPQFAIWSIVGMAILGLLYGFAAFPMNCPVWHMILAMELLIMASQWYAVIWSCAIPNLRLAVSMCSLTGILAFSIAAFSFPVDQMYGAVGIFSYILPIRYYFLIYIDQALNGIPLYYSRHFIAALFAFPLIGLLGLRRLRSRCLNPIYVP
ncbi:MAG: ABC transporter permease [Pseudoflavonifractor sp.]|nr:ABC transporter permease [Alloprevotella sp.]MCM1117222.1 ABC transporter permease [Pseudoflavonifractor sp.]